jgi:hypothetical protein
MDYFRICASNIWRASNIGHFSADIQITVEVGMRRKPIHVTAVSWDGKLCFTDEFAYLLA